MQTNQNIPQDLIDFWKEPIPYKQENFINILREATCYDCRWKLMYRYLAAGIDILMQRRTDLEIPLDYEKIKKKSKDNGLPDRAYPAGVAEFSKLDDDDLKDSLKQKITKAISKMQEPDYKRHCNDRPVQILNEILVQI